MTPERIAEIEQFAIECRNNGADLLGGAAVWAGSQHYLEVEAIIRELLAQVQGDGWQPIETLTGDQWFGRGVLVWVPENRCTFAVVRHPEGFRYWGAGYGATFEHFPTHWMPLPLPPADGREGR